MKKKFMLVLLLFSLMVGISPRSITQAQTTSTQGDQFEQGNYDLQAEFPFGQSWNKNSPYAGTDVNKVKWEYKLYFNDGSNGNLVQSFSSPPAIGRDGTVYAANQNGKLYAFNKDGSIKWVKEDMVTAHTTPVIAKDGTIYVAGIKFTAVNPDGSIKWQVNDVNIQDTPIIDSKGTIYVRNIKTNKLEAYNSNGTQQWASNEISEGKVGTNSMLISKDGIIYTLITDDKANYLYAHDKNGKELWKKTFEGAGRVPGFSLGLKNELYINDGNILYVLDKDGNEIKKWSTQSANHSSSAPTIYSKDGTIYVGGTDGIFAYNPDYTLKWKYSAGVVTESPVIDKNGIVYFKASNEIHALNPDGTLKWKMPLALTNTNANNSMTIGADGTLYIVGAGGSLIDDSYYYSLIAIGDTYIDKVCTKESTSMEVLKSLEAKSRNAKLTEEEKKEARDILNKLSSITQGEQGKKEVRDILNKLSNITQGEQFEQGKYDLQAEAPFGQNWNRNSPYAGTGDPKVKWEYKTFYINNYEYHGHQQFRGQPAIGRDGTIYIGNSNKKLYAFNKDGSIKWVKDGMADMDGSPVIGEDGTIYVPGYKLTALNPDGSIKWKKDKNVLETPIIDSDGTIYVLNYRDDKLEALNPDGSTKWVSNKVSDSIYISNSMRMSKDGTIYTLIKNTYLTDIYAHDKENGKELWKKTLKGHHHGFNLGLNGELFINGGLGNSENDVVTVLDKGGNLVKQWTQDPKSTYGTSSTPVINSKDGTIYIGGNDGLYAYNPDYTLKWKYTSNRPIHESPIIDKNGVIYFKSDTELYAVNSDGTLKWKLQHALKQTSGNNSIIIDKDGNLYTTGDGSEKDNSYDSIIAIGDSYTDNVCTKESTFMEVLKSLEAKSKNAKLTEEEKKEAREILNKISNDLDKKDN